MKDRIFKVMKWSGLNLSQFAEAIQVSPALLSSVKTERTKPTLLLIENIKKVYPDIDINWLITGAGNMLVDGSSEAGDDPKDDDNNPDISGDDEMPTPAPKPEPKPTPEPKPEPKPTPTPEPAHEIKHQRAVKQVLLMYNDGTYESFEK